MSGTDAIVLQNEDLRWGKTGKKNIPKRNLCTDAPGHIPINKEMDGIVYSIDSE